MQEINKLITCPYCFATYECDIDDIDFSDYPDDIRTICTECNRVFDCDIDYSISFGDSREVPCANGEPHNYQEGFNYAPKYYSKTLYCEYCNHCKNIKKES